ncbi:MAG TPA: MFS transporter [Roseiflexaceae bacterium]|nr:MFS transporter [Roseiflexaceae bacterium]
MPTTRLLTIFVLYTFAYFLSYFLRSANAVIARDLAGEFALSPAQLGFMTSVFFASFAALQLPIGAALDRFGARLVTSIVLLLAVAGCLVFAAAPSFAMLSAGRALIGAGMACALMGTIHAYSHWFDARRLATISGITVSIGAIGGLAASTPLAWLSQQVGWRVIFVWSAGAVALAAALIAFGARGAQRHAAHGGTHMAEHFGMVFRERRLWYLAPLMFTLIGTTLAIQTLWGGPYVLDVLGGTPIEAGNALFAFGCGVALGYGASGWLADRAGIERVMLAGSTVFVLAQLPLAFGTAFVTQPVVMALFAILGFTGSFNLLLLAQVRRYFPASLSGRATTAINLFGFAGVFAIQWALGVIISLFPADAGGHYVPAAYATAFACTCVANLVALAWYGRGMMNAE